MKYFLSILCGCILGISVSSFVVSNSFMVFSVVLSGILFLDSYFFERDSVKVVGLCGAFIFLGIFLGGIRMMMFVDSVPRDLEVFESHNISMKGEVVSVPISNGKTQKFIFDVSEVLENNQAKKVSGKVLVTTDLFPHYHYGDVVSVSGLLKRPEKFSEADGRVFDYPKYLLKDRITETISFGGIKSNGENRGNIVLKILYGIEEKFVENFQSVLPEPEAGLLSGITLGTQTLSQNITDSFRSAGLSHIVVLSGYNITVVADTVLAIALFFTTSYAFFIAIISVILFVLMSGAGASSVRAGIMSVIALVGKHFGKTYSAGRALFFACVVMVAWNPMTLLFDPSFHLSVLATIAIVYMSPIVLQKLQSRNIKFLRNKTIIDILATTLSAQIFVLPYILYMSGKIQILSLPANMLVLPFVPITMLFGFFTGLFGIVSRFLGLIFGLPSYGILYYDIFIADIISTFPFAQISVPDFPLSIMLLMYAGLFYFLYTKNRPASQVVTSDGYTVIE